MLVNVKNRGWMNKVFCCESTKHGEYWRRGNARSFTANARSFRTNEWGNSTTSRSLISYPKAHSVSEREESRVNEQGFLLRINKHGEYWRRGNARSFTANARSFRTNEWGNSTTSRSLISYPKAHSVSEREESRVNEQGFFVANQQARWILKEGKRKEFYSKCEEF